MVVEKGDHVIQKVKGSGGEWGGNGYARQEVDEDGIYIGPDYPILTIEDLEDSISELRRLKKKRQREMDRWLDRRYLNQLI